MKIYTKTGDAGTTSLVGGTRVSKAHPRVMTYGDLDELISYLGLLRCETAGKELPLRRIQIHLMNVSAHLANDGRSLKLKPLDEAAIASAAETRLVVTVENGIISGGAGEGVLDALSRMKATVPTLVLGIDDSFVPHGKISQLLVDLGLDAEGIAASVKQRLA